jgi:large subunit ribosomal protein L10
MSVSRARKEKTLDEITIEIGKAGSIVLTDFTGINVAGMTRLRNEMRRAGVGFKVIKNTVLRRALAGNSVPEDAGVVALADGPTAIAWSRDEVLPIRVLRKFAKENDGKPVIKGGLVSGQSLDAAKMLSLADLPGREELLARIAGSMNAPLQGFVNVTSAVLRSFLYAVEAVRKQKEQN